MKTKALTRAAVMHVLFKRKRVFDSRHGYGGELLGRGWRTKEMAISSYSGWNIVFNVSIPFDSPLLDIKLSRVQERAELQFRCQAQLAYPPYTLQLMRNYCRTWLQSFHSPSPFFLHPGESFKARYSFRKILTIPLLRCSFISSASFYLSLSLYLSVCVSLSLSLYVRAKEDEFIKVLQSDTLKRSLKLYLDMRMHSIEVVRLRIFPFFLFYTNERDCTFQRRDLRSRRGVETNFPINSFSAVIWF